MAESRLDERMSPSPPDTGIRDPEARADERKGTMTTTELDRSKVEAFAGQVIGIINGGALTQMLSIGHHTGLFDTMAGLPPSTSTEIARAAGLNERYVRECLGALVTGKV